MPTPPRFTDPPGPSRKNASAIPDAVVPPSDNQGDVVADVAPDEDLSDLFPAEVVSEDPPVAAGSSILIHVLEDGFTAAGRVWYRGQELEYSIDDPSYADTKDRHGKSWLVFDDASQMRAWGRVMFRRGPWPGEAYEDPRAAAAERSRGRRPPALAGVAPPRAR